jgi:hypothetical protein
MTNGNGGPSNRIMWWLIGGILTPIILTAFNTLSATVSRVSAIESTIQEIERRLNSIDRKIDRLIDRDRR